MASTFSNSGNTNHEYVNRLDLAALASEPPVLTQSHGNFYVSGHANVHVGDNLAVSRIDPSLSLRQNVLKSLAFPQMNLRAEQISSAYPRTCQWLLQPMSVPNRSWSCFRDWLLVQQSQALYWIHGKPGSGKSTIIKFLDRNSLATELLSSWAGTRPIVRARFYFWKAGHTLQNSMKGFYRCLLFQFLQQCPQVVTQLRGYFSHSSLFSEQIDSDIGNLQQAFFDVLEALVVDHNLFLVIDGLDECEQVDGQDELIDVVLQASELPNVKICVSSRPENIFKDAFHHCPQLRVEDLTFTDIHYYVTSQLHRSRRWAIIEAENKSRAFEFTMQIIYMTLGVFLWATLAMRDLLQALRDGDSLDQLYAKLKLLPADLDRYFQSILSSIKFEHRREASTLLQLALFNEDKFGSIFSLRLIDTFFVAESDEDFCLGPSFEPYCRDLADEAVLRSRTDSSLRKLSSRCKGLLESVHWKQIQDSDDMTFAERIELVHNTKLVFLHRSLRDFLLQPQNLSLLYSYTNDRAIDARQYLISARLVQLLALTSIGLSDDLAVGLASHLLGALSVNAVGSKTSAIASLAKPAIEWLAQAADVTGPDYSYWYINGSLEEWYHEHSDFLTLAIDFQLSSYVLDNMTTDSIRSKQGRPILDYILQPRFNVQAGSCGYALPDIRLLEAALARGSEPNELIGDNLPSVWASYLSSLPAFVNKTPEQRRHREAQSDVILQTLAVMIRAGAACALPISWLAGIRHPPSTDDKVEDIFERFANRWKGVLPTDIYISEDQVLLCPVSAVVSSLELQLRSSTNKVVDQLLEVEKQSPFPKHGTLLKRGNHYLIQSVPV